MVHPSPDACSSFSTLCASLCHRPMGAFEWSDAAKADTFTT